MIDKFVVDNVRTHLQLNKSIKLFGDSMELHFPSLNEMKNINSHIGLVSSICEHLNDIEGFDIFVTDMGMRASFNVFLDLFLEDQFVFSINKYVSERGTVIDESNYNDIIGIVKIGYHFIEREEYFLPSTEAARKHILKVRAAKKELKRRQKEMNTRKMSSNLYINNLVSTVCGNHASINHFNVGNLTYYQLVDLYRRMLMKNEYEINVQAKLSGSTGGNEVPHFSTDLKYD